MQAQHNSDELHLRDDHTLHCDNHAPIMIITPPGSTTPKTSSSTTKPNQLPDTKNH
jgi:hypothetical protein